MANFVIRKNQVNNITLTLRERSQLVNPYYLIVFENNFSTSKVVKYASVLNQAPSNIRYDLIVIEETASPDALLGEVRMLVGEWSYRVYESANQTLDILETTGRILQHGLVIVIED
jgi:hypothetical protein